MFLLLFLIPTLLADFPDIKRTLTVNTQIVCPNDILNFEIISSDGMYVDNVELRLVRYYPYQGLIGITVADGGVGSFKLTKNGTYRIYIRSKEYYHEDYIEFEHQKLCPAIPPKNFSISIFPNCKDKIILVKIFDEEPLSNAIVYSSNMSTITNKDGEAIFPLTSGSFEITANIFNYTNQSAKTYIDCNPPKCIDNIDCNNNQICSNFDCLDIFGYCGYAENHSWFQYECCRDEDCVNSSCINNSCKKIVVKEILLKNDDSSFCISAILLILFLRVI